MDTEVKTCSLCGNPLDFPTLHHWYEDSVFARIEICSSCNSLLGKKFGDNYPTWKEQVEEVRKLFQEYNKFYLDHKEKFLKHNLPPPYSSIPIDIPPFTTGKIVKEWEGWLTNPNLPTRPRLTPLIIVKGTNHSEAKKELFYKLIGLGYIPKGALWSIVLKMGVFCLRSTKSMRGGRSSGRIISKKEIEDAIFKLEEAKD